MKIVFTGRKNTDDLPKDFKVITLDEINDETLNSIIDSSCEAIIIDHVLERLEFPENVKLLHAILGKVRINGQLLISGINADKLCELKFLHKIPEEDFNTVISQSSSLLSIVEVMAVTSSAGLDLIGVEKDYISYRASLIRNSKSET
jgi:2-polyprenyl-3-methyl-5-hydroxy-6-metoxy-1,4-benzoquinol methylase